MAQAIGRVGKLLDVNVTEPSLEEEEEDEPMMPAPGAASSKGKGKAD